MSSPEIRVLDMPGATSVGESPVWDAAAERLWWVDIRRPTLHRSDPATGHTETWFMPAAIGSLALCRSGAVLVALKTGVHRFDPAGGALDLLAAPEPGLPDNRLNDGKASPEGRFVFGSMDDGPEPKQPTASLYSLYSLSGDGACRALVGGLVVSNGIAWSPDGRTLWYSCTRRRRIWSRPYDPATGAVGDAREIAAPTDAVGRPDGAAMDAEGGYWSAGVSAGVLNRWLPDGTLDRTIALPVQAPTMPCFGGPGLRTLFVTSLRRVDAEPIDGRVIALDAGVQGVPVGMFDDAVGSSRRGRDEVWPG